MFVEDALDKAFMFKRVQTVNGGFVGGDLATFLDLPDEGGCMALDKVALDKVEHRLLFVR